MKKKWRSFIGLIMISLFILGLLLGSNEKISQNNYFEYSKDKFEDNITTPDGEYHNLVQVEGNLTTSIAQKIEKIIQSISKRIFN